MAPKKGEFPMTERLREWYRKIGAMGGKKGGKKGGHRAALNMTPAERIARAKKGAAARWKKRKS